MEVFILKLIAKKFQRLHHVKSDLEIFVYLTVQIGDCIIKTPSALCLRSWGFYVKPAFFCNFLNDDFFLNDALITELFQICPVVSQTLGEGTL